ncbi:Universal stress protein [Minicystis rosea]|nr:Universal stress protein [Minicystis rosea]
MSAPSHLLVAVDFNTLSERALERALDLAGPLGARVTVLHVYALPVLRIADSDIVPSGEEAVRLTADAEQQLEALLARHERPGITVDRHLRTGRPPAEEILATAEELGADMIVVGTHGRGALGRALLGSVAMDVLRTSKIPVLSVHEAR